MSNASEERVLVVPTSLFHEIGRFQGFRGDAAPYLDAFLRPEVIEFRPRSEVEDDPGFKQLIPYVVFRHVDEAGAVRVFEYVRGKGMGEGRLHRKRSIGVGGHISLEDTNGRPGAEAYAEGLRRELEEEVVIETPYVDRRVGLINDDETEVGRVHLGVVHCMDVEAPNVTSNETDLLECGFRPVEDLLADMDGFETWSSICLEALFRKAG